MTVCVRPLNPQPVIVGDGNLRLKTVVPRMAAALVEESVFEGIVVHGVERKNSILRTEE